MQYRRAAVGLALVPNSCIGVTADPQSDGAQKAVAIHIFLEAMRGTGEGHRPWDPRPGTT